MMATMNKLREELSKTFIASLSEGQIPWRACWQQQRQQNAITGKPYRGVNALWLAFRGVALGFTDPRWCTFNQANKAGWKIQKGSKGSAVEYWAYYDKSQKKLLSWSEAKKLLLDDDYAREYLVLKSRVYTVFNAQQIEGIPELDKTALPHTNIDVIRGQRDTLLRNMNLDYREQGQMAYYSPATDTVTLPPEETFFDTYSYACTFLHECGHATGHPSRLNRDMDGMFGTESYAKEELRAEIASAFTAQAIGLHLTDEELQQHMDLHKAYIQSWADRVKEAPKELFLAIKDAEKISDYLIEKGEFTLEWDTEKAAPPEPAPVEEAAPEYDFEMEL